MVGQGAGVVNGFASNVFDTGPSGKRMGSARTGSNPVLVVFFFLWRHGPVLPRHVPSGLVFFVQFARAKPCLLNLECVRCVQFALPSCRECRPRGLL